MATFGAAITAAGTFLPWVRSGARRRNSFEIFSLVDRLGFSASSVVGWGIRVWPVVPFLLAAAVTLLWFSGTWVGGSATVVVVVYAAVVATAVRSAPSSSLITVEGGPVVTLIGAAALAAGAALTCCSRPS
jgi:hypothetical protein